MTSARHLLLPIAGFALWGAAFIVLYAVLSLGCRLDWESAELFGITLQRAVLVSIFAAHLLALAGLTWWTRRRRARIGGEGAGHAFLVSVGFYAGLAALAATAFNFAAIFWLTPCAL